MTERLAETTRRIENLHQLETVVTAMRGISASRAQQARGMLHGLRTHAALIAGAIGQALALVPDGAATVTHKPRRNAVILFCGEQGFAGAFSDRMLATLQPLAEPSDLFLIGTRGAVLAGERGLAAVWQAPMVPHAGLVPGLAGRIADALYGWVAGLEGCQVSLIVPTWSPADGVVPDRRWLLPSTFAASPWQRGRRRSLPCPADRCWLVLPRSTCSPKFVRPA
jgi:F-type H+-transporting ATPase subunit gamma